MTAASFINCVEKWTEKEIQLNRLHEGILAQRESLLKNTTNYFQEQNVQNGRRLDIIVNSTIRNQSLIEDIDELQDKIYKELNKSATPRFSTLQNNYWSMVNGLLPIWEESVGISTSHQQFKKTSSSPKPKKRRTPKASRRIK